MAQDKRFTGTAEVEFVVRDEASQRTRFEKCKKNRGHPNFIPVKKFSIQHVPMQDDDILEIVMAMADLTVFITVMSTSPHRPKVCLDVETPYPINDRKKSNVFRTGSGRMFDVRKFSGEDDRTCACQKCRGSSTPSRDFAEVYVFTATHVVFDAHEAQDAHCWLFYDDETRSRVTIEGLTAEETDVEKDGCRFTCVTCDTHLIEKLSVMFKRLGVVWEKLRDRYKETKEENRIAIIVSHPHGGAKYVTVGYWIDMIKFGNYRSCFTYTTDTCPGSSGAAVYILGSDCWYDHVHSGVSVEKINYSTAGWC